MWFKQERDQRAVQSKVQCIIHVVKTVLVQNIGTEWLQTLLNNLFKGNMTGASNEGGELEGRSSDRKEAATQAIVQTVISSSTQIIEVIVSDIICAGDALAGNLSNDPETARAQKMNCLAAVTTLWLFAKAKPMMLVPHIN